MAERPTDDDRADDTQARTRRRFQRRQWARRWMSWRYVVAALLVLVLAGTGVWLVFFSARTAVHQVEVRGNALLTDDAVRRAARVPLGEQLVGVDLAAARARVASLAEVESVDVTREWPDGVRITVVERTAVAVVRIGATWRGLDASGVVFREFRRPPKNLPRVTATGTAGSDALTEAAGVVAGMSSELAARVDHVEVETIDQIVLVLRGGTTVQWGSSEESDRKAEVLQGLLEAHPAQYYDVSVPGSPTAR